MQNKLRLTVIIALVISIVSTTTVFAQSGRTEAFFKIFASGNYHMRARISGMDEAISDVETYVRGDRIATITSTLGQATRMVLRDNKMHVIMDAVKMIMVVPSDSQPNTGAVETDRMRLTGSGNAAFNGKTLPYEEYSNPEGYKTQYFLDGNNLAGIRSIIPRVGTIDLIILALDQNVPNNVFDIPSGYQVQDMTSFGLF